MNKRSLTVLFCSVSALVLSACIITGTGSGGVGGGTTTNGTGGEGTISTSTGGVGGGTTSTGTTCDPTYKCSEAITPPDGDPTKLCENDSAKFYDEYFDCVCTNSCKTECGSNACSGTTSSEDCNKCRQDKCKAQFDTCANDA